MPARATVMTWNVQRLTQRSKRKRYVLRVIERYKPDVLFLSEVGHDLTIANYREVGHAMSLSSNMDLGAKVGTSGQNQLNTKLFVRNSSRARAKVRSLRQAPGQPRMTLKANIEIGDRTLKFGFIHSKASPKGGREGLQPIRAAIQSGELDAGGGDLNIRLNVPANLAAAQAGGLQVGVHRDQWGNILPTHRSAHGDSTLDGFVARPGLDIQMVPSRINIWEMPHDRDANTSPMTLRDHAEQFVHVSDHGPGVARITY